MALLTAKELCVLSMGATAAIALGFAMHAEHGRMVQACEASLADAAVMDAVGGSPVPVVPTVEPIVELPPPTIPLVYGSTFSFVVELPDGPYLVLSSDVDPSWVGGEPKPLGDDHVVVALHEDVLPEHLRSTRDRTVTLYGERGALGTGRVGGARLVASAYGDLSVALPDAEYDAYQEAWNRGEEPSFSPSLVWDEGRRLLVAPIETSVVAGSGALWARDTDVPPPTILVPGEAADAEAARKHLLMHPGAASLAADMAYYREDQHVEVDIAERVVTRRWLDLHGRARATTAWFDGPEFESCGGLAGMSWAMTTSDGDATTPLPFADDVHGYGPTAVFDLDNDGWLDVLMTGDYVSAETTLLAGGPTGWRTVATLPEVPFHGCPC